MEIYAGIEPIDGVSEPASEEIERTEEEGQQMFDHIKDMLGG